MIRIAIDAMGGDFGPEPIIEGVVDALKKKKFLPILVGDRTEILSFLPKFYHNKVEIVEASDVIEMSDSATDAHKRKDSSIYVAAELVRDKKADALVSAGHSGATMAVSLLRIGRIKGIARPALATLMPSTTNSKTLVLDVGAVTDCKPQNLFEFGILGEIYAKHVLGVEEPRVGLLAEDNKGNELTKATFPLLKELDGFIGNVEGKDIFNGRVDVVVCDGYTGNILLKTSEGVVSAVFDLMKQHIRKSLPAKIGALMMRKKVFKKMKKQVDKDEYGGAPLLGINGCSIISHGASNAKAIKNAVFQAIRYSESDINEAITKALSESTK